MKTCRASLAVSPAFSAMPAINIATFALGRDRPGGSSLALVEVDGLVPDKVLAEVKHLPGVQEVKALRF